MIVTVSPAEGWLLKRFKLLPSNCVACCGMTEPKWCIKLVIVSGPANRVKTPSATSSTAGTAMKAL